MKYKVAFLDYWHLSSGLSAGAKLDSTVVRDENGLPYIPGKTIKGLIKEQSNNKQFLEICFGEEGNKIGKCHFLNIEIEENTRKFDFVTKCFGSSSDEKDEFYYEEKIVGECNFSNVEIEENTRKFIIQEKLQNQLFDEIASTKIDENGIAKSGSLREIEVVVPLSLYGEIKNIPDEYKQEMIKALKKVKRMGLNRNRGLGRCVVEIEGEGK
jgi:CRISPR/Cas system CSM-associated protein Csm3 (group 7 of RAMP superfamily)